MRWTTKSDAHRIHQNAVLEAIIHEMAAEPEDTQL